MEEANFCKLIKKRTCHIEGEEEKVEFISNTEVQPSTAVNLSPKLRNAAKSEQVKEADNQIAKRVTISGERNITRKSIQITKRT